VPERLDGLGERDDFFRGLAKEVEGFLLRLEECPEELIEFVRDRVAFLGRSDLSDQAKALLLESNYSLVQEVMKHRESQALRWVCVWVI